MLTHIDVFLGVALVMLAVSLLLTIFTQLVSFIFNLRGNQLRKGLTELFDELKVCGDAKQLAEKILKHRFIANGLSPGRLAPAISRADLFVLIDNAQSLLSLSPEVVKNLQDAKESIKVWFDHTMSRVSNRFTFQTRVVTMIAGTIAAFVLQLDAFGLVTRLYANSDLRATMAGAAGAMVAQSQQILTPPTIFADAVKSLADQKGLPPPATKIETRGQALDWIANVAGADAARAKELTSEYDKRLDDVIGPAVSTWLARAAAVDKTLAGAGFRLVPDPYQPWHFESFWVFLGVLTSAALLSLGAPFWFNALKTVSNLRPAIANQVEAREQPVKKDGS